MSVPRRQRRCSSSAAATADPTVSGRFSHRFSPCAGLDGNESDANCCSGHRPSLGAVDYPLSDSETPQLGSTQLDSVTKLLLDFAELIALEPLAALSAGPVGDKISRRVPSQSKQSSLAHNTVSPGTLDAF